MQTALIDLKKSLVHYSDELYLFAFLLIYLATWTLLMAWLPLSMNLDDIEQVVWSRTWQWGYYKHPPLPSLLMFSLSHLFGGPSNGLMAFAAQGCNVVALVYVWLLAKQILSRKLAHIAVLMTSLIGYYNFRAVIFNHNTVSFPFTAALIYYFYCAVRRPERLSMWLLLGVAGGLAMLTKYSAILVFASFFIYVIWQQLWKNPLVIRGLCLSVAVFFMVFSPNIIWLVEHDWLPFRYLDHQLTTSEGRLKLFGKFLVNLGIRWWYALLAVWLLAKMSRRPVVSIVTEPAPQFTHDRRFLLAMLFLPLALATVPMFSNGNSLNSNWVAAFFFPAGILLVQCFFRHHDETRLLQNTSYLVWGIQIVVLLVFVGGSVIRPAQLGHAARTNYPSQQLADTVSGIWHTHQQQPLRIVIANNWLGGNVLLHTRPEPMLFIDNEDITSPWLNRHDVAACGALVLTTMTDKLTPAYSDLFSHAMAIGEFSLMWGHTPTVYAWAILSPEQGSRCRFHAD